VTQVADSIKAWTGNHAYIFPFLAFIIPLIVRTIPEILMGPYVLGFDTMGFYIPNTLVFLHSGGADLTLYLLNGQLFYAIFTSIVAAGGSAIWTLKVIPPLLLGFLGLSIYAYAKKGLAWSSLKSVFVAVLGTVYFVALRSSWDLLREEFGFVFLFVVLMLLIKQKNSSWKHYALLSLAIGAVVLSQQLVSVIMFGVVIFTVAYELFRKNFSEAAKVLGVSLPWAIFFVIVYLSGAVQSGFLNVSTTVVSPLTTWTGFASYQSMLISEGGFFLYCFLPLLPLIVIGICLFGNLQLRSWLILSLILLFIPFASVSPFRWILMLMYPFAFYATDSLSRLKSIKWKRFHITASRIAILYLVLSTAILSFGFIFMTSENAYFYFNSAKFNSYPNQIPSSMLQNTLPVSDCQSTINALQWFKENVSSSAILLTHTAFYGWALLTLSENQVRNYGFGNPANAATAVAQEGYTQIYLIWWINGQGWYEQPTVASAFHEIYQSGEIAIYHYAPN